MKVFLLIYFIENRYWLVIQFAVDYYSIGGISTMAVDTMKKGSIEKQLLFLTRSSCFFVGKDHSEINRIMAA